MSNSNEDNLQRLKEYILDEDKIVTATWIATNLNTNIKQSENLIEQFVNQHREKQPQELSLTYVLSGTLTDGRFAVILAGEAELAKRKNIFARISSECIYSVQKCKEIDFGALSLVDSFIGPSLREHPIVGSVVGKNCVKRDLEVRKIELPVKIVKTEPKVQAKVTVTGATKQVESKQSEKPKSHQSTANSKSKSGLAKFFTKNDGHSTVDKISAPETKKNSAEITITNKENTTERTPKTQKSTKRQRSAAKKSEQSAKRHKRIVVHESDSDDIFGSDDEDVENKSDDKKGRISSDEEPTFMDVEKVAPPPKNKKRKLVNKTFEDESGYMLTTKEWVYESASDDENEGRPAMESSEMVKSQSPKIKEAPVEAKKVKKDDAEPLQTSNGKGKKRSKKNSGANQPTLMSFFKKT